MTTGVTMGGTVARVAGFIAPHVFRQRLAAEGLEVTLRTVRRWCRLRKIDARYANGWQIREREVDRVVATGVERKPRGKRTART